MPPAPVHVLAALLPRHWPGYDVLDVPPTFPRASTGGCAPSARDGTMRRYFADYLLVLWNLCLGVAGSRGLQRRRRFAFLLLFLIVHPPLVVLNNLFLALDRIFCPGLADVRFKGPLFIVGNHRTGSTALHRLLARDTADIVTFRMLDLFFPSVLEKRFLRGIARVDRGVGRPLRRIMDSLDGLLFREYSRIHDTGFLETEEDEFALLQALASASLLELFPQEPRFRRHFYVDSELPAEERHRITSFYREFVTRQVFHAGPPEKLVVSKSPLSTGKVATLAEAFPDSRFLILVRSPSRCFPPAAACTTSSGTRPAPFRTPPSTRPPSRRSSTTSTTGRSRPWPTCRRAASP